MWIYDDIHYYRYLKIYPAIQTPPVEIPGTDGLVCHLVCTRYCPGGEVSKVKPNAHLPETDVEDAALFSIGIESDQSETKLAGRVEICFDDVRLVGSFGEQAKDKFVDWSKPGTVGAGGWSFTPAQTLYYHMNGYAGYSHPGFFAPTLVKVVDIKFKLFYPGEKTDSCYTTHPVGLGKLNHLQLVADIKGLLGDTETSDIVIQSKEKKFHCHRTILCARSSVLRRLLDTDMKETRSGVIAVDDIDVDALEAMIEYIYTDEITKEFEDTASLVYAADKYDLKGLLEICFGKFKAGLDDDQLVEILILSDRHNLPEFKNLAAKRILADKTKFINDKDFQKKMEKHPKLLFELFKIQKL